jgi:hypothetical protein
MAGSAGRSAAGRGKAAAMARRRRAASGLDMARTIGGGARAALYGGMSDTQDTPPDRLSTDPRSPFFDQALLQRGVGIRFKGVERNNVEEYCISEGWVRVAVGKTLDRRGNPMTMKLTGPVEAYFHDTQPKE